MKYYLLAALAFESQFTALIVLAILASVFFNRVPTLLKWTENDCQWRTRVMPSLRK